MTKLEEMQSKLASLLTAMQDHIDNDELDKADSVKAEIDKLADKIEKQKLVDKLTQENEIPEEPVSVSDSFKDKTKENASFIRACIKKFSGNPLTEAEDSLLCPQLLLPTEQTARVYTSAGTDEDQ